MRSSLAPTAWAVIWIASRDPGALNVLDIVCEGTRGAEELRGRRCEPTLPRLGLVNMLGFIFDVELVKFDTIR